jgi:hypothetical protein
VIKTEETKGIAAAIVQAGRVGLFRAEVAARHPFAKLAESQV